MTIFDNIFNSRLQIQHLVNQRNTTFPPFNIIKQDEYSYQISVALAGYSKQEIQVIHDNGEIRIERIVKTDDSQNVEDTIDQCEYVYKGIAKRNFRLKFPVNEYIVVDDANMVDGMLTISLKLVIPEDKKPKTITIS